MTKKYKPIKVFFIWTELNDQELRQNSNRLGEEKIGGFLKNLGDASLRIYGYFKSFIVRIINKPFTL